MFLLIVLGGGKHSFYRSQEIHTLYHFKLHDLMDKLENQDEKKLKTARKLKSIFLLSITQADCTNINYDIRFWGYYNKIQHNGWIKQQKIIFHSCGGWKSKIKVPAGLVSPEASVLVLFCVFTSLVLTRYQCYWIRAPHLWPYLAILTSLKAHLLIQLNGRGERKYFNIWILGLHNSIYIINKANWDILQACRRKKKLYLIYST